MPPNRAALLRRRFRQADAGLVKAMSYISDVYVTVKDVHVDVAADLRAYIRDIDYLRQKQLELYRRRFGGTERGLYKDGDEDRILSEAQYIDDPYAEVRRRRAERVAAWEQKRDGTTK